MKPKKNIESLIRIQLFLIILLYSGLFAQSFEGTMSGKIDNKDINLFIWVDLIIPTDTGKITGSYFYKTIGKEISLSGKKDGTHIILAEKDKKMQMTGIFSLQFTGNDLNGSWSKPQGKDTLRVELYKTSPAFRKTAKIPKLSELLADDIEFYTSDGTGTVDYRVLFARNNLLSVGLSWENYNYTARYGSINQTYDLSTRQKINLFDEISDKCKEYLCSKVQEQVSNERANYSDSEWIEALYPNTMEHIIELFTVKTLPEKAELYLINDSLVCYIQDFCEQYYSAGNRAMTFDCMVYIPFKELKKFIKKETMLLNLFAQ